MHEVKVFDCNGKLIKTISAEEVERKYWIVFAEQSGKKRPKFRKKPKPTEPIDLPPENEY